MAAKAERLEDHAEGLSRTLPGLKRFHHVGHWAGATIGISMVAVMARNMVKDICKEDGKRFETKLA